MKKVTLFLVLIILCVAMFAIPVSASESTNMSTASVTFEDGFLEIIDPSESGESIMDMDFGSHLKPLVIETYGLVTPTPYVATVADGRYLTSGWEFSVMLDQFTYTNEAGTPNLPANHIFDGSISLNSAVTGTTTNNLNMTALEPVDAITVLTDSSPVQVATATDALKNGEFTLTWQNENVNLLLAEGWDAIVPSNYQADMTWTLALVVP